jgi:hypothetical protein
MAHNHVPLSVVDLGVLRDMLDREWTNTRPGRRKAQLLRLAALFAVFAEEDDKAEIAVTMRRARPNRLHLIGGDRAASQ